MSHDEWLELIKSKVVLAEIVWKKYLDHEAVEAIGDAEV